MKYLFILLLAFLISCGDNHGGDNDEITDDTTLTPPTDTLGVDSVVAFSGSHIKCVYLATDWEYPIETMESIQKRKVGDFAPAEKSIVYYQLVKRTLKYKIQ